MVGTLKCAVCVTEYMRCVSGVVYEICECEVCESAGAAASQSVFMN